MSQDSPERVPGLDAWRGLGVLLLFNLLFFSKNIEATGLWSAQPDLALRLAARLANLLYGSGILGLDMLFMVSGFLAFRAVPDGRETPLSYLLGRYGRLLPLLAVTGIPAVAYGGVHLGAYFKDLLLLAPHTVPTVLGQAFAWADAFLLFFLFAAGWKAAVRLWSGFAGWAALAATWVLAALLVACGPGWLPVNGHFLSFLWGAGAAKLADGSGRLRKAPGWLGGALLLAAVWLCYRSSAGRGESLYYLLSDRNWETLLQLVPLQGVLAVGLAFSLNPRGFWRALWPVGALGRASYCFFMAFVQWSFVLTDAYGHGFASPLASMAFLYGLTLGVTLAVALVFQPFFEPAPLVSRRARA